MGNRRRPETVLLPQVNPGNAELALQMLREAKSQRAVTADWLEDQGITQPKQALSLLRFLRAVDETDRLSEEVVECRLEGSRYGHRLRELAIAAYADAGVGGRDSLAWLGRDAISRTEIKARLRGPFAGHDLKQGGHKNAFYCLCALHELLRDLHWLQPTRPAADNAKAEQRHEEVTAAKVIQAKAPNSGEARRLLLELAETSPPTEPIPTDERGIRVPFAFDGQGRPRTARIYFESPMTSGDYWKLGNMLQKMAEAVEDNSPGPRG